MQNPINYPAVNYSITQDPWTKEFNINFSIKIKPDTVVKEVKATIPSITNPLYNLEPLNPTFGKSNTEIFQKNFANLADNSLKSTPGFNASFGLSNDPIKPLSVNDLPKMTCLSVNDFPKMTDTTSYTFIR
jgi:hypothetical protein